MSRRHKLMLFMAMSALPTLAAAQNAPTAPATAPAVPKQMTAEERAAATKSLVERFLAVLKASPANASRQDLMGKLSLAIDQNQSNCIVTSDALMQVMSSATTAAQRAALRALQGPVANCRADGTAALADNNANNVVNTGLTTSPGGGSSNYVNQ